LERQEREGWGAKIIDRLSADLREAYPDMSGLSLRNLKYMRTFAAAWPDPSIVQRVVAQIPWRINLALLDKLNDSAVRQWYAEFSIQRVENLGRR
jgi:predicted nuclease of restriction endonuclease-like (RecB) superfamily